MKKNLVDTLRRRAGKKLVPSQYRDDPSLVNSIYKWLLIGLLIRLIFMPIALHMDLLYVYGRSSLVVYKGMPRLMGQIFVTYIHAFSLWIFKPLMPYFPNVLNYHPGQVISWRLFYEFVTDPNVPRTLFLLKLPYLIFDLGCAFLILAIFLDRRKGVSAFKFWMINPVVIFASYIFARYEAIAVFFILLSLYYARNNSPNRSLFSLGMAIVTRLYPVILLPFFIIILEKNPLRRLKLVFWGFLPLGVITMLSRTFGQTSEVGELARAHHADFLLRMGFSLGFLYDKIFIFVAIYAFLLLYVFFNTDHSFRSLWKSSLILMLFFFATCFFHPQYFMWLIPLLTLQVVEDRRFVGLFLVQLLCFAVYTFQWKRWLAGYLFMPLNASYFAQLRSPFEVINQYYPAANFIGIFRSIFSAISFWMVYLLFKNSFLRKREENAE